MRSSLDFQWVEPSATDFERTHTVLAEGESLGVATAFVGATWSLRDPGRALVFVRGKTRRDELARPIDRDTIFDIASVSKVFTTSTLIHRFIDRGWLTLEDPVQKFFPEFSTSQITIAHLLSHTSGLPWWRPYWEMLNAHFKPRVIERVSVSERQALIRKLVLSEVPEVTPGDRAVYSDLSFLILGFILEEITQMPLDHAVREHLWNPMRVEVAEYRRITRTMKELEDLDVPATELAPLRGGIVQGVVHDENCYAMGGYAGHAGVFTRARELVHFGRELLGGFLSRDSLDQMWTRVGQPVGCERTLGWDSISGTAPSAGKYFSPSSVGHLGFTGTSLWIDPEHGRVVVLLTNRVHPTRENIQIRAFRPQFHDALMEDLMQNGMSDLRSKT